MKKTLMQDMFLQFLIDIRSISQLKKEINLSEKWGQSISLWMSLLKLQSLIDDCLVNQTILNDWIQ